VRSDKKSELKKNESEVSGKDKDSKTEKSSAKTDLSEQPDRGTESQAGMPSVWKRDDSKKQKDESNAVAMSSSSVADYSADKGEDSKPKGDKSKETTPTTATVGASTGTATATTKKDDQGEKSGEDKAAKDRRKTDHRIKDQRNWTRYAYQGGSYGSSRSAAPKLRRSNRATTSTTTKGTSRRDSKYSESDYSDEVSGSGREDRNTRGGGERDKSGRSVKSSKPRYDRDDRNDYRSSMDDREYGNLRGGGRSNRDYYYKPAPRGRNSGFRSAAVGVGKRMDGYGPPSSRNPFGGVASSEEKARSKPPKESSNASEQNATEKKNAEGT